MQETDSTGSIGKTQGDIQEGERKENIEGKKEEGRWMLCPTGTLKMMAGSYGVRG